jgi:pantetheine-phosphate adenylyltransferase
MAVAIYPGSFDPLTNGHVSLIHRALQMFDRVIVAIAVNPKKTPLFTVEERKEIIREAFADPRIEIDDFCGLLVDYARRRNVNIVLRGLRAVSDFEYEFQMANMNRKLSNNGVETVFLMTGEDYFYISSQIVREVASLGANVKGLVPPNVERKLAAKFGPPGR